MNKIYILVGLIISLVILTACGDFTAPERFTSNTYSISGLLIGGRQINVDRPIYVCRSSSIEDVMNAELFVGNADVKIIDKTNHTEFNLTPVGQGGFWCYVDMGFHTIRYEHTYRIEVQIPGYDKTITAETTVPKKVDLVTDFYGYNITGEGFSLSATEPYPEIKYDDIDRKYPLALKTQEPGVYKFFSELYCLEDFSTQLEFTNPVFGSTYADTSMVDAYNASGESIRRIRIMGPYVSQPQPDMEGNYLKVGGYSQAFVFYGRYQVTVYAVDDNYFNYLFMPEGYLHGGVSKGLGYFGSATGNKMYTKIIK